VFQQCGSDVGGGGVNEVAIGVWTDVHAWVVRRTFERPGYEQAAMAACTCDSRRRMHDGHEMST
jgi:hypothetical protein